MKKSLLIGLGAAAVLVAAGAAYAAAGHGGGRMMKHMISARIEDAEDYIDATPQQRQVIEQAKENVFKAFEARHQANQNAQLHQKVVQILTADKLDTDALYALADQHANEIREMAKVVIPEIQKVHDVLTPAQRQKLAEKAQQMHDRRGHGPNGGGFGGPPGE